MLGPLEGRGPSALTLGQGPSRRVYFQSPTRITTPTPYLPRRHMPTVASGPPLELLPGPPAHTPGPSRVLDLGPLGKMWTIPILEVLQGENEPSFGRLQRLDQGLTRRALSRRLSELRRDGYIVRIVVQDRPLRTTYRLTERGARALPILRAICELLQAAGEPTPSLPGRPVGPDLPKATPCPSRDTSPASWGSGQLPVGWSSVTSPGVMLLGPYSGAERNPPGRRGTRDLRSRSG